MNQGMIDFCNKYKEKVKEIAEEYASNPEQMQEELQFFERSMAARIGKLKITDEDKIELLDLFNTEDAMDRIVTSLESDANKVKFLEKFQDQRFLKRIIQTIDDDELKIDALKYIASNRDKADIFVTLTNKEKISSFLEADPDMKNAVVNHLKTTMKSNVGKLWDFMKNAGLENQIIPHVLFDSKYEILNSRSMNEEIKKDIETYLGKSIPENIEEMSIYERVGVDLDALQGEVVTSREQLGLNEFQKMYLDSDYGGWGGPKKEEPKRKVSIKDFEGSFSPTLAEGVSEPKNWEEMLCGLKRMSYNIEHHSESKLFNPELNDTMEALGLQCIDGKYYTNMNGNHRLTLLKAKYLSEVKMANGDPERLAEIEEKYTVDASYVTELPSNANELMGINTLKMISELQNNNIEIKEFIEDGKKAGYEFINEDVTSIVKSEGELQEYLQQQIEQLKTIDDGQLLEKFNEKVQSLNLDMPENQEYKNAFETMTGISLEPKQKEETLEQDTVKQEDSKSEEFKINEFGEIIRKNPPENKIYEEQQPQKQMDDRKSDVNLWMNRFKGYNSAIDRVSQNSKTKFVKMKSDIVNAIKGLLKERTNNKEDKQVQDTNERW